MRPRLSLVTLGVADVSRSRVFYEGLGWRASSASQDGIAFFQLGAMVLALFARDALAEDARVPDRAGGGFAGISLAQNYGSPAEVDAAYAAAVTAGADPVKLPAAVVWGGYSGYLRDPDGFCWELAHNPFFDLGEDGALSLPP